MVSIRSAAVRKGQRVRDGQVVLCRPVNPHALDELAGVDERAVHVEQHRIAVEHNRAHAMNVDTLVPAGRLRPPSYIAWSFPWLQRPRR